MVRSAGMAARLLSKDEKYVTLKLPSGEMRKVLGRCMATIGQVSNEQWWNRVLGKAGASNWVGRRPQVRGVAMNPVDHPMGGGELSQEACLPGGARPLSIPHAAPPAATSNCRPLNAYRGKSSGQWPQQAAERSQRPWEEKRRTFPPTGR